MASTEKLGRIFRVLDQEVRHPVQCVVSGSCNRDNCQNETIEKRQEPVSNRPSGVKGDRVDAVLQCDGQSSIAIGWGQQDFGLAVVKLAKE